MFNQENKKLIEAALYISGDNGLSLNELQTLLQLNKEEVQAIMDEMILYYKNNENSAFVIMVLDNKYKVLTKPELNDKLMRLAKIKYKNPLTKSLMEVLTIIAYNQPITKKEIQKIKPGFKKVDVDEEGNSNLEKEASCDYAISRLRELELIEPIILSDQMGKPFAYKVTSKFLDVFGLKNIKELPKLKNKIKQETKE